MHESGVGPLPMIGAGLEVDRNTTVGELRMFVRMLDALDLSDEYTVLRRTNGSPLEDSDEDAFFLGIWAGDPSGAAMQRHRDEHRESLHKIMRPGSMAAPGDDPEG